MAVIAVDFGGTNIKIGIIKDGRLLCKEFIDAESENGIKPRLSIVKETIGRMLDGTSLPPDALTHIGIAIPGIVDFNAKCVLDINKKYSDVIGFDFKKWCKDNFNLPMIIENDTKSAIMGETRYGCCPGAKDAVLMSFGTGIGTAVIIDGKLLRGKHHQAGCLGGHIAISDNGNVCTCGGKGCIEAESGGWALPRIAKGFPGFKDSLLSNEHVLNYKAIMS
ncbi:MAG: ROK family protein, partial [Treponema sp.]|nr:ROK family protein [Treponema sp.]